LAGWRQTSGDREGASTAIADASAASGEARQAQAEPRFGFWRRNPGLVPPPGLLVPLVLITAINPLFLDARNLFNVFRQSAIFLALGAGVTVVMAARGIDLSVGSTVALSA
jgi:predicted ABC-type sugar transport system permease subunit